MARTQFLTELSETGRFGYGHPSSVRVTPDGKTAIFLRSGPRSATNDVYALDLATGTERALLSADSLVSGRALSPEAQARLERARNTRRGIASIALSRDGESLLIPLAGRVFLFDLATNSSREITVGDQRAYAPQMSPDGKRIAFVRKGDLWVLNVADSAEKRLTKRSGQDDEWGSAEFVAQEEMSRYRGFWWAPDSRSIVAQHTDNKPVETLWIHDPKQPRSTPRSQRYPRAGTDNAIVTLALISVESAEHTPIEWDRAQFPYLATVRWQADAPLTLLVQDRAQRRQQLMTVSADGVTSALQLEEDATWLNLDQTVPYWLTDGSYLWSTERTGSWTLEVRDSKGNFVRTVVDKHAGYANLIGVDQQRGQVYFRSTHKPAEGHVASAPIAGGEPKFLTTAPGDHHASLSAMTNAPPALAIRSDLVTGVRNTVVRSGGAPTEIRSAAETPPWFPNIEFTDVECAIGTCHAALIRPRDFQSGRQYPVIVYVYGGPHHQVVTAEPRRYFMQQWMADHGAIVVMLDGRGTPNRGRAFERSIAGDVSAGPLADQVSGLKNLADRYSELDLARVGVYGWSFGGYMTQMMVLRHPELYKVGVAGAPVSDWEDYDTHYTERYMGHPKQNVEGYKAANVLTHADKLRRPLLLLHGTVDDNVYPVHTFRASDAYFRAGKAHSVLPLSGFTHHVTGALPRQRLAETMRDFLFNGLKATD
ncbi:MAG: dipeptidyl-peptidase-4 [Myxococcota bacterium]|jgi:dipeptidyl-peptidase-4